MRFTVISDQFALFSMSAHYFTTLTSFFVSRLKSAIKGASWKLFENGQEDAEQIAGMEHTECRNHSTRKHVRVEVDGHDVWGREYRASTTRCSSYFLITSKRSAAELLVRVEQIRHCLICARLIVQADELGSESYSTNNVMVSHIYVTFRNQPSTSITFFSDDYSWIPCFCVVGISETFYCVADQWQCSD